MLWNALKLTAKGSKPGRGASLLRTLFGSFVGKICAAGAGSTNHAMPTCSWNLRINTELMELLREVVEDGYKHCCKCDSCSDIRRRIDAILAKRKEVNRD